MVPILLLYVLLGIGIDVLKHNIYSAYFSVNLFLYLILIKFLHLSIF